MLFDLMKVNVGTWRAPNCVLRIPALKGNEAAGTPPRFLPMGAHLAFPLWKSVVLQLPFL